MGKVAGKDGASADPASSPSAGGSPSLKKG